MAEIPNKIERIGISAVLVPCSSRKQKPALQTLQASSLAKAGQAVVAQEWLQRLKRTAGNAEMTAQHLYRGRGFRRVADASGRLGCPMFVVSAGLGLVLGSTLIPSYDLTLSPSAATPLPTRISGTFDPAAWWDALVAGPFSRSLQALMPGNGRILVALTRSYAELIGPALAASPLARSRLRLFGAGLAPHLPAELQPCLVPFDERLDVLMPGTRLDGAARALAHFAETVAKTPIQDLADDLDLLDASLSGFEAPRILRRQRHPDAKIRALIRELAPRNLSVARALQHLRNQQLVACEASRFRRLFEESRA